MVFTSMMAFINAVLGFESCVQNQCKKAAWIAILQLFYSSLLFKIINIIYVHFLLGNRFWENCHSSEAAESLLIKKILFMISSVYFFIDT